MAVWRVVCHTPSANGTITDALSHIKTCDTTSPDAKEHADAFLWAFVMEASVSEPLIVRATEWNDIQLKQQEAVRTAVMIKDKQVEKAMERVYVVSGAGNPMICGESTLFQYTV